MEKHIDLTAVIEGLRYDTQRAEIVACRENGYMPSDFSYVYEELYHTKNGRWFIAGEGGAFSKYAESFGNTTGGSKKIIPLSADEAREWLEEQQGIDALEKYFSSAIEEA